MGTKPCGVIRNNDRKHVARIKIPLKKLEKLLHLPENAKLHATFPQDQLEGCVTLILEHDELTLHRSGHAFGLAEVKNVPWDECPECKQPRRTMTRITEVDKRQ